VRPSRDGLQPAFAAVRRFVSFATVASMADGVLVDRVQAVVEPHTAVINAIGVPRSAAWA
jgi:hypothetical protein